MNIKREVILKNFFLGLDKAQSAWPDPQSSEVVEDCGQLTRQPMTNRV